LNTQILTNHESIIPMETTEQPSFYPLSPLKFIEAFYARYPPEKAQAILWRWFLLSIKNEFVNVHPKEMEGFEDFFENLSNLVMVVSVVREERLDIGD